MNDDESNDDGNNINVKNIDNYKGYFFENEEPASNFYEFGAHFPYKELCKILNILRQKQVKEDKNKKIEKIAKVNKSKISQRERNNTRNKQNEININIIQKIFKSNRKSRNIRALDPKIGSQNELTYVPKKYNKNIFSTKKDVNKVKNKITSSFKKFLGQQNYLKINNNVTDIISINSTSNKKINKNDKNKNTKIHCAKYPKVIKKYILTRNQNKKNLYQQIKLFSNNKTLNQEKSNYSFDLYMYKTFQTIMKETNNRSVKNFQNYKFSSSSNSKNKLNKKIQSNKDINEKKNNLKLNYNTNNKMSLSLKKGKNYKFDKIKNKSLNGFKIKNSLANFKRKLVSTPLDSLLEKKNKLKNNILLPDIKKQNYTTLPPPILNIYQTSYNSSYKLNNKNRKSIKNNNSLKKNLYIPILFINNSNHFNINDSNDAISFSFNTNKKYMLNSKTIDKSEINKEKNRKKITQSSFNQFYNNKFNINIISQGSNLSTDCLNKKNKIALYKKIESNINKFIIYNCNNKSKENSRNKFNNLLLNNLSSINITNNKNTKNENNIDIVNINRNQQNTDFSTIKNKVITHNKTFNNLNSSKNMNNKQKTMFIPFSSNKKNNFVLSLNKDNSSGYLNKNKNNVFCNDKLFLNKSKKRLNLDFLKRLFVKKKQKQHLKNKTINLCNDNANIKNRTINCTKIKNNFSNNKIKGLSGSKKTIKTKTIFEEKIGPKKKIDLKACHNLAKKKENRNSNKNNILYNQIKNYKNNSRNKESFNTTNTLNGEKSPNKFEMEKIVKTQNFNGNKLFQNNFKFFNVYFKIKDNNKSKKPLENHYLKNDKPIRNINLQIPKVKFININNINNK